MLSRTAGTLFTAKPYTIVQYFGVSEPYHTPKIRMAERAKSSPNTTYKTLACQNLITRQKSGWQKGQNARPSRVKARERTYVRDRA